MKEATAPKSPAFPIPEAVTGAGAHAHHSHAHSHEKAHRHADPVEHVKAATPAAPRIQISCCPSEGQACAAGASGDASAHAQGNGHDHSSLPGWARLVAALLAATGAELVHLLGPTRRGGR